MEKKLIKLSAMIATVLSCSSGHIVNSGKGPGLSFKTGGRVFSMYAEEGSQVRQGPLPARLNITGDDASINEAQTAYDAEKWNFIRATNLLKARTITLKHWEYAESAFQMATESLQIASLNKQFSAILTPESGTILRRLTPDREIVKPESPVYGIKSIN